MVNTQDYSMFVGDTPDHSQLTEAQLRARVQELETGTDLCRLLLSVQWFLERFNAKPTVKFATDRAGSEFFEYVIALADAQSATHPDEKELTQRKAAEELVDVFYAGFGAFLRAGGKPEQVLTAWNAVIRKNDAKTTDTHSLNAQGGIEKKHKEQS